MKEHILHGERYWRDPAAATAFLELLPEIPAPPAWVVLMPLSALPAGEEAAVVVFVANAAPVRGAGHARALPPPHGRRGDRARRARAACSSISGPWPRGSASSPGWWSG